MKKMIIENLVWSSLTITILVLLLNGFYLLTR